MLTAKNGFIPLVAATFALAHPALSQSIGPAAGNVGPGGGPGAPNTPVPRTGAHDQVQRGPPKQATRPESANLTPSQCKNFLASWNDLAESSQASLTATKIRCEAIVSSQK